MRLGATASNIPNASGNAWAGPRSPMAAGGGSNPNTAVTTTTAAPAVTVTAPASTVNKTLLYAGIGLLAWMVLRKKKA